MRGGSEEQSELMAEQMIQGGRKRRMRGGSELEQLQGGRSRMRGGSELEQQLQGGRRRY